jgi:hypothetical protein
MATAAPPRGANPFDDSGVRAGTGGVRRYPRLHASLLDMLRHSVQAAPGVLRCAPGAAGWRPRLPRPRLSPRRALICQARSAVAGSDTAGAR